jgi:hypothetical protein
VSGLEGRRAADSARKGEEKRSWVLSSKTLGVVGPKLDWESPRGFRPVYLRGEGERKAELLSLLPNEDLCWVERALPLEGGSLGVEWTPVI